MIAGLQLKITAEDKIVKSRIEAIVVDWEANKPIQGSLKADTAVQATIAFETRVNRLREEYDTVSRAKEALHLELIPDNRLDPVLEEISDLKAVWTALSGVWAQVAELREALWSTVQSRKLRQHLDGLLSTTREMPSRMRQYAAFEYVQDMLRQHLKSNVLVSELKSEALRERHWRQLFKVLRVSNQYSPSSMTLGSVWNLNLRKNETAITEIIMQAQGEMALEEFLKQVRFVVSLGSVRSLTINDRSRNAGRIIRSISSITKTRLDSFEDGTISLRHAARISARSLR